MNNACNGSYVQTVHDKNRKDAPYARSKGETLKS